MNSKVKNIKKVIEQQKEEISLLQEISRAIVKEKENKDHEKEENKLNELEKKLNNL